MRDFVKKLENLPMWGRLLLVIFIGAYGNLIRLGKSCVKKNIWGVILAVIMLFSAGLAVMWIVDIICVILNKPILWFDEI